MNKISKTMLQIAALATLSAGFGLAGSPENLTVKIPFDFTVGDTTLPAGAYTIDFTFGSPVVRIRDANYQLRAQVMTIPVYKANQPSDSELVFRVHGNKHYLASTWNASTGMGTELNKTAAEREQETAGAATTRLVLVARR